MVTDRCSFSADAERTHDARFPRKKIANHKLNLFFRPYISPGPMFNPCYFSIRVYFLIRGEVEKLSFDIILPSLCNAPVH